MFYKCLVFYATGEQKFTNTVKTNEFSCIEAIKSIFSCRYFKNETNKFYENITMQYN